MSHFTPRMRMFAGPNGSGKSTIQSQVAQSLWGQFVNADNIEAQLKATGYFGWKEWNLSTDADEMRAAFANSWVKDKRADWQNDVERLSFQSSGFSTNGVRVDSYFATAIADFLREKLMAQKVSFTFETVMSSDSKVRLLEHAQSLGYRTYLYFVATRDPQINVERVANRVAKGGHPVPPHLTISRYERSLDLLLPAIRASNRAYLWDNSGAEAELFGEFDGNLFQSHTSEVPLWFKERVLDKI